MKKFMYITALLALTLSLFSGCGTANNNVSPTSTQENAAAEPSESPAVDTSITIITPYFYSGSYDAAAAEQNIEYLVNLFAGNGFDVQFDMPYYSLDSASCYEEYFSYLSQSLAKNNTIALVPGYKSELLSGYIDLMNLQKETETYAPNYYNYTQRNSLILNSNNKLVVSAISEFNNTSVIFIPNSIAAQYTNPIEKSEEYLSFIDWAREQYDYLIPSVILSFHDDITSRSNIIYDMFLPQQGYIPLGSYFGSTYSLCVDAKNPENIYDTTALGFYDTMMENIEVYANNYRIVVKHENTSNKNFNEYSSVIMPFKDMEYYSGIADYNFYPPNYTMEILNPSLCLERTHENVYLAAAQNTDQSESLKLIDWIFGDIQNYISVKYGDSALNYAFDTNEHIVLSEAGKQYIENSPMSEMISNLEFEAVLQSVPSNYVDEINSITYLKGDNFYAQYENYQTLITVNNYTYNALNRLTRRWEASVRALEVTTERKVIYEEVIIDFENIDDLIYEISK